MNDYATWPLFLLSLISLCCMILDKSGVGFSNLSLPFYRMSKVIIFLVSIGIVISLYHDSTQVLNLHF